MTWNEYQDVIAANVEQDSPRGWEPLRSWGAVMLLSRVASFVRDADQGGALFDPQTLRPRLTGPPFLRALEELQAVAHSTRLDLEPQSEIERRQIDPRAASRRIAAGETLLAIGLPPAGHRATAAEGGNPSRGDGTTPVAWTQLPGSIDAYNHLAGVWEKLDRVGHIPVLGVGDRLASVTTSSRNAATAFQLLAWLAEPVVSSKFARAGDGTMPVRRTLASSSQWYDQKLSAEERSDLAKVLNDSLSGELCLIVPRIPGVDEYLAALAEAVEDVVFEQAEPKAALEKAAASWELITERRGRDAQRQAYLRHLGIDQNVVGTLRVP